MKVEQKKWTEHGGWNVCRSCCDNQLNKKPFQLVLVFGSRLLLDDPKRFAELKDLYPEARILITSTAGNICCLNVDEDSIVVTAIAFESKATFRFSKININEAANSYEAGKTLGSAFSHEQLRHIFLISDGHKVNGSNLIKGILSQLPSDVNVTGGLAGDGNRFEKTLVGLDEPPIEGEIVAIGFYGTELKFGFGSIGGWDPFGIERQVTRSSGNILYELDGKSALELYKKYLGDQAQELPGSALLFPLAIRQNKDSAPLVRTILSIDEKEHSMTFAGDVPQGWYAQLMKANFDRLIDGAITAAHLSYEMLNNQKPDLAILISCFGRRLVLGPRTEEEIEGVFDIIGKDTLITGFYSYGEIAPTAPQANCELHNQTMTITTISERV